MKSISKLSRFFTQAALVTGLSVVAWGPGSALAGFTPGHFFLEDFEDGDSRDSAPVRWKQGVWNAQDDEVIDGDLHILGIRSGGSVLAPSNPAGSQWLSYADSSIRTRVRITNPSDARTSAGLIARSLSSNSLYSGGIRNNGELWLRATNNELVGELPTDLDPVATDVVIQFDLFGDQIGLTVWEAGQPMPATPQLSITDSRETMGTFGMIVNSAGTPADVAFRSIRISPTRIPEPSGCVLLLLGTTLLSVTRRTSTRG